MWYVFATTITKDRLLLIAYLRMNSRYNVTTSLARGTFYVLSIGGILSAMAYGVWMLWNRVCAPNTECEKLSYLEAIGLVSIAYVVYSSIRFAQHHENKRIRENLCTQAKQQASTHTFTVTNNVSATEMRKSCQHLSAEQKAELKKQLAQCCGKNTPISSSNPS